MKSFTGIGRRMGNSQYAKYIVQYNQIATKRIFLQMFQMLKQNEALSLMLNSTGWLTFAVCKMAVFSITFSNFHSIILLLTVNSIPLLH